jgi:hypothetical protein
LLCCRCRKKIPDNSVFCLICGSSQPEDSPRTTAAGAKRPEIGEPDSRWLNRLWLLLGVVTVALAIWFYRPAAQSRFLEWRAAHNCSVPGPGNYVYVRKADFGSVAAVALAAEFQQHGFSSMCGNLYGNSATLVGPYPDIKQANAAFWRLHLTRAPGDYIRLLRMDPEGGVWSDPSPVGR